MKQNKSISAPKTGMAKDIASQDLKNIQYNLAVNVRTSNESGSSQNIQLEPSNFKGVVFPINYKVVGYKTDILKNRTYYFLTSITDDGNSENFKRSSFGYVDNNNINTINYNNKEITDLNEDCDTCGIKAFNPLVDKLETLNQVPSLTYIELINDKCLSVFEGLNLDINFPIKKIEINQEKLGTTIYWDDYRNPPRYLNITDLEEKGSKNYLFTLDIPCEDVTYSNCIDVDKLLISPKYNRIVLEATEQQIGGNLKKGSYEFWGAYCDLMGNEMTQYCTPTNPISIFDENSNVMTQTETDEFTNFAIKIKVKNLDIKHFKYYKIAVVERNNVANTQSVFLAGIYPTTDDTVVYTHSGSNNDDIYVSRGNVSIKKRMDFNTLNAIKPSWEKAKFTMVSGDVLWHGGLIQEEELNLQPVMNLFGALLHWQTSASSENLYKSAIATSKYKAYPRDEVQPFSIRLLYTDGGYSTNIPLVARPASSEESEILIGDKNLQSVITNGSPCVTTDRNKKWQIYNTATVYEDTCVDIDTTATVILDEVTKSCNIEGVNNLPFGTVEIETVNNFTSLSEYVVDNPEDPSISIITSALGTNYSDKCVPNYIGDCDAPSFLDTVNKIGKIVNEIAVINYKEESSEYLKSREPKLCAPYKRTDDVTSYEVDTDFSANFMNCSIRAGSITPKPDPVYFRDSDFNNENCGYAEELINQPNPADPGLPVFLNYDGSLIEADLLQNTWEVKPSTITGNFKNKLHNKAQFFKVVKEDRDKIVFEITKQTKCNGERDSLPIVDSVRYTIYNKCTSSGRTVLGGGIVDLNVGVLEIIDISSFPDNFIIAIDSPIISLLTRQGCPIGEVIAYLVVPPCGCFSVYARDKESKNVIVSWDNIRIDKVENYIASCRFRIPKVNDCDPIPYKKGVMAYWESTEEYDDNKELWDSSEIKIKPEDISLLSIKDREEFLKYYTISVDSNNNYILKGADFRCKPIRHPKFPDNTVAPYIIDDINFQKEASSIIFPMGVELDSNVIITVINIAYNNKLITKKQRDKIQGYEILRGDNSISKSVIANGIAFDVYNYKKNKDTIHFSNFPFNDLGDNKYCLQKKGGSLITHPFNSEENYLYTFLSPDIFLTRNTIPTEVSLQGFVLGTTSSEFTAVDKHSEWTVLGDKARITSERLAIAEVTLETVIQIGGLFHNQWFVGGVGSVGGSIGGLIAAIVASVGIGVSNGIKIGKYRYDWLKTFRDLGRTYNFASFQTASANYNKFLKADQYSDEYLRRLTIRKYLKDGDYTVVDENDGKQIKINNWKREASAFLSTGEQFPFNYINYPDYTNYDNNKKSVSNSSNFVASEVGGGENTNYQRNVGSPYFALKNYIPDQWGKIDSIKWLTTNNIFKLTDQTSCKPMYGGTYVISRFSWRRKTPIFRKDAIGVPDKLPFMYSRYANIGFPRFYCDYELDDGDNIYKGFLGLPFPDINSFKAFDSETGRKGMYFKPPSKFYTSVHGVVNFLVESEINCNFRYARKEPKDNFYPQNTNLSTWLQETNLPMSEPNTFFYNSTYSFNVSNAPYKVLDKTYSKEIWQKRNLQKNAVTWSQKDVNENDLTNPWLVYKPLDWYEFKTNNGDLIDMHNIESNQFVARFENRLMLHNSIDVFSEKLAPQNRELGVAGMFYQRPLEFKSTDLGFMGTQHTDIVSTPFGHFWVDALRGRIFKLDQNGKGVEIISEQIGDQPTNMKQWFREHLPMKILKDYPNIDIDNKYKGLGFNMWWDDRESRLFITKRDYRVINKNCLNYIEGEGFYTDCEDPEITCPEGYLYNELTNLCEKTTISSPICPNGYTYNELNQTCILTTVEPANCEPIVELQEYIMFPNQMLNISNFIITVEQGKDIIVDWGDGNTTSTTTLTPSAGNRYTFNHTYSATFTGEISIKAISLTAILETNYMAVMNGDLIYLEQKTVELSKLTSLRKILTFSLVTGILDQLPKSLKDISIGTNSLSGNINTMPPNAEYLSIGVINENTSGLFRNTLSGNINSIVSSLKGFSVYGKNTISGNIVDLKLNLETFRVWGNNTVTGIILDVKDSITFFDVGGNNTISGDMIDMPPKIVVFSVKGANSISNYTSGGSWLGLMSSITILPVSGGLSSNEVDNLIIDLSNTNWANSGGSIRIQGTNQVRTSASDSAVLILQGSFNNQITPTGKKVTVFTN